MKYKKILLVNPYPQGAQGIQKATVYPPLGLAYIASVLRNNNIQVKIVDANILKLNNEKVTGIVSSYKPDLVGISLNVVTAKRGVELSLWIKAATGMDVCIGGPFVSSDPIHALKISKADVVVIGEGEKTILEICRGVSLSKIKGIAWVNLEKKPIVNEPVDMIQNLDEIPFPAHDLLPLNLYRSRMRKVPMASIFTSRGCPYRCTFCSRNVFGRKFRAFSANKVVEEIEMLISRYGVKQIDILDDCFTQDIKRAEEILDLIIKKKLNILINVQNGIRVENLTYAMVKKMKKAGFFKIAIGCESGNDKILKEIKKDSDLNKIKQAIKWFKKEKMIVFCFFMLGFPNDDKKTILDTINFSIEADPMSVNISTLIPFPGTEIYSQMKSDNLIDNEVANGTTSGYVGGRLYHKCRYLSQKEVIDLQSLAYRRFYLRWGKIAEVLSSIKSFSELRWYFYLFKEFLVPFITSFRVY